jgi:hypothetical protein
MGGKDIIKQLNIKQPSRQRIPTQLVFSTLSQSNGVQNIEERGKEIYLSILCCSDKIDIPLMSH